MTVHHSGKWHGHCEKRPTSRTSNLARALLCLALTAMAGGCGVHEGMHVDKDGDGTRHVRENLLRNGGFEQGGRYWKERGWVRNDGKRGFKGARTPSISSRVVQSPTRSGNRAMMLFYRPRGRNSAAKARFPEAWGGIQQAVGPIEPKRIYRLVVWYKARYAGSPATMKRRAERAKREEGASPWMRFPASRRWRKRTARIPGWQLSKGVVLRLGVPGRIWFDDVRLERTSARTGQARPDKN